MARKTRVITKFTITNLSIEGGTNEPLKMTMGMIGVESHEVDPKDDDKTLAELIDATIEPTGDHYLDSLRYELTFKPKPVRIQRRRTKGYKLPPHTKCVTRGTKYGNPFKVGDLDPFARNARPMTAERCVELFKTKIVTRSMSKQIKAELRGWNLACYCGLDQPCHAALLLEIANEDGIAVVGPKP